jgi:hypothetical protein
MDFRPKAIKLRTTSKHWGPTGNMQGRSDGTEFEIEFDCSGFDEFDEILTRKILTTQRKLDSLALLSEYCKGAIDVPRYKTELKRLKDGYRQVLAAPEVDDGETD